MKYEMKEPRTEVSQEQLGNAISQDQKDQVLELLEYSGHPFWGKIKTLLKIGGVCKKSDVQEILHLVTGTKMDYRAVDIATSIMEILLVPELDSAIVLSLNKDGKNILHNIANFYSGRDATNMTKKIPEKFLKPMVNVVDNDKETPLHIALKANIGMARIIINYVDSNTLSTPFERDLTGKKSSVSKSFLEFVIGSGDPDLVEQMLKSDSVNWNSYIKSSDILHYYNISLIAGSYFGMSAAIDLVREKNFSFMSVDEIKSYSEEEFTYIMLNFTRKPNLVAYKRLLQIAEEYPYLADERYNKLINSIPSRIVQAEPDCYSTLVGDIVEALLPKLKLNDLEVESTVGKNILHKITSLDAKTAIDTTRAIFNRFLQEEDGKTRLVKMVNKRDGNGYTPFRLALKEENLDLAELLLENISLETLLIPMVTHDEEYVKTQWPVLHFIINLRGYSLIHKMASLNLLNKEILIDRSSIVRIDSSSFSEDEHITVRSLPILQHVSDRVRYSTNDDENLFSVMEILESKVLPFFSADAREAHLKNEFFSIAKNHHYTIAVKKRILKLLKDYPFLANENFGKEGYTALELIERESFDEGRTEIKNMILKSKEILALLEEEFIQTIINSDDIVKLVEAAGDNRYLIIKNLCSLPAGIMETIISSDNIVKLFKAAGNKKYSIIEKLLSLSPEIILGIINSDNIVKLAEVTSDNKYSIIEKLLSLSPEIILGIINSDNIVKLVEAAGNNTYSIIEKLFSLPPEIILGIINSDNIVKLFGITVNRDYSIIEKLFLLPPEITLAIINSDNIVKLFEVAGDRDYLIIRALGSSGNKYIQYIISDNILDILALAKFPNKNWIIKELLSLPLEIIQTIINSHNIIELFEATNLDNEGLFIDKLFSLPAKAIGSIINPDNLAKLYKVANKTNKSSIIKQLCQLPQFLQTIINSDNVVKLIQDIPSIIEPLLKVANPNFVKSILQRETVSICKILVEAGELGLLTMLLDWPNSDQSFGFTLFNECASDLVKIVNSKKITLDWEISKSYPSLKRDASESDKTLLLSYENHFILKLINLPTADLKIVHDKHPVINQYAIKFLNLLSEKEPMVMDPKAALNLLNNILLLLENIFLLPPEVINLIRENNVLTVLEESLVLKVPKISKASTFLKMIFENLPTESADSLLLADIKETIQCDKMKILLAIGNNPSEIVEKIDELLSSQEAYEYKNHHNENEEYCLTLTGAEAPSDEMS